MRIPSKHNLSENDSSRLPSFTIMEMLVAMAISSIIIASGAFLYLNFNKYVASSVQKNETENAVILFSKVFQEDVRQAEDIEQFTDELTMKSERKGLVSYVFSDEYIIRQQQEVTDTFSFVVENLVISFDPLLNRFQSLEARLISGDVVYPVIFVKTYENATLFNKDW